MEQVEATEPFQALLEVGGTVSEVGSVTADEEGAVEVAEYDTVAPDYVPRRALPGTVVRTVADDEGDITQSDRLDTRSTRAQAVAGVNVFYLVGVIEALSSPSSRVQRLLNIAADWSGCAQPVKSPPARAPRTARQLQASEVDELVAVFQGGTSVARLARQFGVHRGTVSKHLRARGIDSSRSGLSSDDVPAALELYREGWTYAQIAERFGVGQTTVRDRLHEAGVPEAAQYGRTGRNLRRVAAGGP